MQLARVPDDQHKPTKSCLAPPFIKTSSTSPWTTLAIYMQSETFIHFTQHATKAHK